MVLFDTHAHYDDEKFDGQRDEVIANVFASGVARIVNASTTLVTCANSIALSEEYDGFYAACGIHPEDCGQYDDVEGTLAEVRKMLEHPKVVAIGEIGLDNHWPEPSADIQRVWFDAQLQMAEETGYPVIIHDREAHGACMDAIKAHKKAHGVFHSYSGSAEMAKELVKLGWYVSFSGSLTFKNAVKTVEAAAVVPLDRLLIETDCPYLAPHPHRGERNDSSLMHFTAEKLAEIKGVTFEEIAEITFRNSCRLFGIG